MAPTLVPQDKPVEAYRNTFANLALPLFAMAEPIPPKVREFIANAATLPTTVLGIQPLFPIPLLSATDL
jgi:hypothetical protein